MVAVESRPGFAKTFIMTGWVLSNHYAQFAKLYLHIITYQTFCFRYSCLDSELPDSHTHYNYQSLIQMDHTMIHVWKVHLASLRNFLLIHVVSIISFWYENHVRYFKLIKDKMEKMTIECKLPLPSEMMPSHTWRCK